MTCTTEDIVGETKLTTRPVRVGSLVRVPRMKDVWISYKGDRQDILCKVTSLHPEGYKIKPFFPKTNLLNFAFVPWNTYELFPNRIQQLIY